VRRRRQGGDVLLKTGRGNVIILSYSVCQFLTISVGDWHRDNLRPEASPSRRAALQSPVAAGMPHFSGQQCTGASEVLRCYSTKTWGVQEHGQTVPSISYTSAIHLSSVRLGQRP
jgi:hypothetical protein